MNVLLTDGNFKHTLAAVRSLGRQGATVVVLSHLKPSMAFFSRYCSRRVIAPDPEHEPGFGDFLLDFIRHNRIDVVLPVSFAAVMQTARIRNELEDYARLPIAGNEALAIAGDKSRTIRHARDTGIPVPRTWYPRSDTEAEAIAHGITYPAVIKGSEESGFVRYANSPQELGDKYRMIQDHSPVIQEYITGEGYGFFALYNHGRARAVFMHHRIREYPVTGGPSALAESIYDEELQKTGMRLLDSLNWHGPAMVEFKKDAETGKFVLMEINPKLWGSLELAIASGVDFPGLACRMAVEGEIEPVFRYRTGVRFRWLFPADIFHAMTNPAALPWFFRDFADRSIRYDIDIYDIRPTFIQMGMTAAELLIRLRQGRFWRPHGQPRC